MKKGRKVRAISQKAWEPIIEKIKAKKANKRLKRLKMASIKTGKDGNKIVLAPCENENPEKNKLVSKLVSRKRRLFVRLVQGGAPGLGKRS